MNTPLYSKIDTKGVETGDRSKGKNPRHMRVLQGMKHMRNASCDTIIKPKTLTPSPFLDREHAYQNTVARKLEECKLIIGDTVEQTQYLNKGGVILNYLPEELDGLMQHTPSKTEFRLLTADLEMQKDELRNCYAHIDDLCDKLRISERECSQRSKREDDLESELRHVKRERDEIIAEKYKIMKQCMTEGEGEEEGGDYRDSMHNINISQLRGPHGHRTTLSNSSTATGNTGTPNMTMIWEENSKTIDKLHKEKKSMEDQLITIKMRHAELEMTYDDLHDNHNSLKSVLERQSSELRAQSNHISNLRAEILRLRKQISTIQSSTQPPNPRRAEISRRMSMGKKHQALNKLDKTDSNINITPSSSVVQNPLGDGNFKFEPQNKKKPFSFMGIFGGGGQPPKSDKNPFSEESLESEQSEIGGNISPRYNL